MADPKGALYKIGDSLYKREEDGSLVKVEKSTSINDGTISKFEGPKVPFRVPGRQAIMDTPVNPDPGTFGAATPSVPGSAILPNPANIKDNMTMAGSIGAGLVGGPAGAVGAITRSAIGTMLGNTVGQVMDSARTGKDFSLGEVITEGAVDAGVNTLLGGFGTIASKAIPLARAIKKRGFKEAMSDAILDTKMFKSRNAAGKIVEPISNETRAAINAAPQVPFTVGMVTDKTLAEEVLTPALAKQARDVAAAENLKTIEKFVPTADRDVVGKAAVKRVEAIRRAYSRAEKAAYGKVDEIAKNHVKTFQTGVDRQVIPAKVDPATLRTIPKRVVETPITETIEGPINIGEVKTFAQENLGKLRDTIEVLGAGSPLAPKVKQLEKTLAGFENKDVIPYATARDIQAQINEVLRSNDSGVLPDNSTRILRNLKAKLDDDVLKSMEIDWPTGSREAFQKALDTTKSRGEVITEGINNAVISGNKVPETFFNDAFKSATQARETVRAAGRNRTSKEFVRQFTDKFWNKPEKTFDGAQALAEWGKVKNSEVAKVVLNKEQRQAMDQFFRRAGVISGDPSNIGVLALGTQEANAGIGTVRDLAGAAGNPLKLFTGGSLLKLTAIVGGRQFSEKVLLNPAKARQASRLLGMKSTRPEAKSLARAFILGGGIGEVILRADNGEEVKYNPDTGESVKLKQLFPFLIYCEIIY